MIMKQGQEQQQEDYSKYNIPCFNCQYVHSCKYYSSNLWIDWIFKISIVLLYIRLIRFMGIV